MKRFIPVMFAAALLASVAGLLVMPQPKPASAHQKMPLNNYKPPRPHRIAHSGGAIDGRVYTNSLEALNSNYAKGYRYFEVDLERTSDDKTVLLHDWENGFTNLFGAPSLTRSSDEFINARSSHGYHQLTADTLIDWSVAHPEARIVLDMKNNYLATLDSFASDRPAERVRFIPFIYNTEQHRLTQGKGYQNPLWLIDYAKYSDADVLDFASQHPLTGVAMKATRTETGLPSSLLQHGVPSLVWTVNDAGTGTNLMRSSVLGLITDYLDPDCEPTGQSVAPAGQQSIDWDRPIPRSNPDLNPCFGIFQPVLADRQRLLS